MQARGSIDPSRFAGWGFSFVPSRPSARTSLSQQIRCLTQKRSFSHAHELLQTGRSFRLDAAGLYVPVGDVKGRDTHL